MAEVQLPLELRADGLGGLPGPFQGIVHGRPGAVCLAAEPLAILDGALSFQDGDAEAPDPVKEGDAVRRGLAGGHLGLEQDLAGLGAGLELLAGLHLGWAQGIVVVVPYDFHFDNYLF